MLLWITAIVAAVVLLRIILRFNVVACTSNARMTGKVVIVTGGNTGIGYHTAKDLAERGARVILACRNEDKGTKARDQIIRETGNSDVVYKHLDLASLTSVRAFSLDIIRTEQRIDVLVNNAGVYGFSNRRTEDGILEGLQINLFAPILLTDLLLPALKKTSGRIVNVGSIVHYLGVVNSKMNDVGHYGDMRTYCNSKFGLMAFTAELTRQVEGVTANACHPGAVYTSIIDGHKNYLRVLFMCICWVLSRSAAEGAATSVFLSVGAAGRGGFYVDCSRWPHSPYAGSRKVGRTLLALAEKLLDCKLENLS